VLGGGGYSIRNVSRCWAYETSVLLSTSISNNIPYNDFFQYYGPDFKLHLTPAPVENLNSKEYMEKVKVKVLQNLSHLEHAKWPLLLHLPPSRITKSLTSVWPIGAAKKSPSPSRRCRA